MILETEELHLVTAALLQLATTLHKGGNEPVMRQCAAMVARFEPTLDQIEALLARIAIHEKPN